MATWRCYSDDNHGLLFVSKGEVHGFKLEDIAPPGQPQQILQSMADFFATFPDKEEGWRKAYMEREILDIFCTSCGHYEWRSEDGNLVCAECAEAARIQIEGRLVPEFLMEQT